VILIKNEKAMLAKKVEAQADHRITSASGMTYGILALQQSAFRLRLQPPKADTKLKKVKLSREA
jgi:hypothetical protein